jgi:antitoxin VapB
MGLNIKNSETERLAAEVAAMTGETKTEAIRRALKERKQRLRFQTADKDRRSALKKVLAREIWPLVPEPLTGKRLSRKEEERILGFGPEGV